MLRTEIPTHSSMPHPTPGEDSVLDDYMSIVRIQAKRIHRRLPPSVDYDELCSAGLVGLWEAYVKFDPTKNVKFATFAQFRVRGAILDSLRTTDWAPRALRSKERAVQEAIRALSSRFNRAPAEDEIASELHLSTLEYQHLLNDLHGLEIEPLYRQDDVDSSDQELISVAARQEDNPFFRCLRGEMTKRLTDAIEGLPERERIVINLYYHEELTLREISQALERSQTTIHQIRTSAVLRLRAALSDIFRDPAFSARASLNSNAKKWSSSTERTGPGRRMRGQISQAERNRILGQVLEPC